MKKKKFTWETNDVFLSGNFYFHMEWIETSYRIYRYFQNCSDIINSTSESSTQLDVQLQKS